MDDDQAESTDQKPPTVSSSKAVEKKKRPASTHEKGDERNRKKQRSRDKNAHNSSSYSPSPIATAANPNDDKPKYQQLSKALWSFILENTNNVLCPSQLSIVAQASPFLHDVVTGLSIWKCIWNKAELEPLTTEGRHSTHYGMVLSRSHQICEACYKKCQITTGYESVLPVAQHQDQRKIVRLCLTCRQAYYDQHPEPHDPSMSAEILRQFGGRIGYIADLRQRLVAARDTPRQVEHQQQQRRQHQPQASKLRRQRDRPNTRADRRTELVDLLGIHGLRLRSDSNLCSQYISTGEGNVHVIVATMVELEWYFRETNYDTLRNIPTQEDFEGLNGSSIPFVDGEYGRERALCEFIEQRLQRGQWKDVGMDANTPARPPRTLWREIRSLEKLIWTEQARNTFLPAGIVQSKKRLLQMNPNDETAFTTDVLTQVLDQGAIRIVADKTRTEQTATSASSVSSSSSLSFSTQFRNVIGEVQFTDFINRNRPYVVRETRRNYLNKATKDPPRAISDFIESCRNVSQRSYNERKHAFIQTDLPVIAERENVHRQYLIYLLWELRLNSVPT